MGLNAIGKVQDTATVELLDPRSYKPIPGPNAAPMSVTVYGPFSATYKRALREQQTRMIEGFTGSTQEDAIDAADMEILEQCITEWNISLEGDEPLPLTPENVALVFREHPWAAQQLLAAHRSPARFLAPREPN